MNVIALSVFFAFVCSFLEIIGGFVAFYASNWGRLLMVVVMILMLKSAMLFSQGVFWDKTNPKSRGNLKLACYLMMGSNYLWGSKYIIDGYYYESYVLGFCITI